MTEYVFEILILTSVEASSEESAREWVAENLVEQVQQMEIAPEDFNIVESNGDNI